MANNLERDEIAEMLSKHREDTFHQDTGRACVCGSHSRAELPYDPAWRTFTQHQADVITQRWREVPEHVPDRYFARLQVSRLSDGKVLSGAEAYGETEADAVDHLARRVLEMGFLREWRKDA